MKINNKEITFSIILFHFREGKGIEYTSDNEILVYDHRTDSGNFVYLPTSQIVYSEERETDFIVALKAYLTEKLSNTTGKDNKPVSVEKNEDINIYITNIYYYKEPYGRKVEECVISMKQMKTWSNIERSVKEYSKLQSIIFSKAESFLKFYYEILNSPVYR